VYVLLTFIFYIIYMYILLYLLCNMFIYPVFISRDYFTFYHLVSPIYK